MLRLHGFQVAWIFLYLLWFSVLSVLTEVLVVIEVCDGKWDISSGIVNDARGFGGGFLYILFFLFLHHSTYCAQSPLG